MTLEEYLERARVIDKLQQRGLWRSSKVRRLVCAIFGTDEEVEEFIANCSPEEIRAVLESQGVDVADLRERTLKRLSEIRAKFDFPQTFVD